MNFTDSVECPDNLSTDCSCDKQSIGLFVNCSHLSENLDDTLKYFENINLQRLTIRNVKWHMIKKLGRSTLSIRSLELLSSEITEIENGALECLSDSLEDLNLSNNLLENVPFFGFLSKLSSLKLNYNELTVITDKSFNGLSNLKYLHLKGNKIYNLSRNALNEYKGQLELLDLSENNLTVIPAQNIRSSTRLVYLDLSNNNINQIANFQLMNLPMLKELRLNNNRLRNISPMGFLNIPRLQHLYLKNNQLTTADSTFQVFRYLEVLDLSHNLLTEIPSFKEFSNLKQIKLDFNQIRSIETLTFSQNFNLKIIDLQNNGIRMISRNSFDRLDRLLILLLANNSIYQLERGMFDGIKSLQELNLRNNSINELEDTIFTSIPLLNILDLSNNQISRIEQNTFTPLKKLFWLDLSSNRLSTFDENTFKAKIANILLDGNPLECDDRIEWMVKYLVKNQVRTFLPYQPDVLCFGPEKYAGIRLKELMIAKANETVRYQIKPNRDKWTILKGLLPSSISALISGLPPTSMDVNSNLLIRDNNAANLKETANWAKNFQDNATQSKQLNAIISKGASRGELLTTDIEKIIRIMPNLTVNVPGIGNVDITKLPPEMVSYVLHGGIIPGLSKEATENVARKLIQNLMHLTTHEEISNVQQLPNLSSLRKLQKQLATNIIRSNKSLSYGVQERDNKEKYNNSEENQTTNIFNLMKLQTGFYELLKVLPSGYDINRIPKEAIEALVQGEIPNFSTLPDDLQKHLVANRQLLFSTFLKKPNATIENILKLLPKLDRPLLSTYSPYDINGINDDLVESYEKAEKLVKVQYYTALLLGLVGSVSIVIIGFLCMYMRKKRLRGTEENANINGDTLENPTMQPVQLPQTSMLNANFLSPFIINNSNIVKEVEYSPYRDTDQAYSIISPNPTNIIDDTVHTTTPPLHQDLAFMLRHSS